MKSEPSFQDYLRQEVTTAEERFERAREIVMAQTAGSEIHAGPALLDATEILYKEMQLYINALRRLAHFAAHQARQTPQKHLAMGRVL